AGRSVRRVVLDPNVLISALLTPHGASARILVELRAGTFEMITSPALLDELGAVLRRGKFRAYVTLDEVEAFLELIRRESTSLEDPEPSVAGPLSEDPGDEYLIRLARAASADALVSGDPHLVRLRSRIPVKSPREFIESLQ
ncbi:MAG: putative toxin-antitoxin system toxin component, PIN family, partial [Candidatus Limnocylindria bacterium]